MKKLDRFLIKSFIGPFVMTFFLVIFILSMQFLWLYIDDLVGKGLGLGVIFEFLGWAACTLIPMALPLATLLASIMTLGGMGEKNELLAMKAAGISLMRVITPVIGVSILISVGAFFAANELIPVAYNKVYTLKTDIDRTRNEIKIPVGTFYDGIDGYVLRIQDRNDETGMMYDLMVCDHTQNSGSSSTTLADSGSITVTEGKKYLIFKLHHGCSYQEENRMSYRDTVISLNRVAFDEQQLIVPLDNYTFNRSEGDQFDDEIMSKGLDALRHDRDSLGALFDTLLTTQKQRYFSRSGLNFLYRLDTTRVQDTLTGRLSLEELAGKSTPEMEVEAARLASERLDIAIDQIDNYVQEDYRYVNPLRRIDIESFRKFTLSIACLIFFFIGAPLGAIIRKGGLGTPVIVSIFFFLIYYIIEMIGKKLARDGVITPFVGTFVATAILLPIGIFLTIKSTQDSNLFNLDSYKQFFKDISMFLKKTYHKCRNIFRKGRGKVRIVFMGTPEFAVGPLDALVSAGFDVAAVVTVPDKPSGRGLKMNESDVKKYAVEHNLPLLQPVSLKDPEFIGSLKSFNANLFVVVAFRMLPKEVWQMPDLGTFNLHASLLPQYRGAAPINWAIINGERVTGVTTFMIDEQIDTGRILFQETCNIEDYDNVGSLYEKLMKMGSSLVIRTVEAIRDHTTRPFEQDSSHLTLRPAPKITKETCHINWTRPAREVELLIRGLSPYPAAYSSFASESQSVNVKIFDAYVEEGYTEGVAGTIESDGKSYISVQCGKGKIRILNLQIAGKKRMDVKDFLLGFREIEKYSLT